jgi:hypothetical protein
MLHHMLLHSEEDCSREITALRARIDQLREERQADVELLNRIIEGREEDVQRETKFLRSRTDELRTLLTHLINVSATESQ